MGLCRQLGGQRWSVVVRRRKLEGLVVGQGPPRGQVHLDAVVDVLLLDEASRGRCQTQVGQVNAPPHGLRLQIICLVTWSDPP